MYIKEQSIPSLFKMFTVETTEKTTPGRPYQEPLPLSLLAAQCGTTAQTSASGRQAGTEVTGGARCGGSRRRSRCGDSPGSCILREETLALASPAPAYFSFVLWGTR